MSDVQPPFAFLNAKLLYEEMYNRSNPTNSIELMEFGYPHDSVNPERVRIFTGVLSKIAENIGLTRSQQSQAMLILNGMGCLVKLRHPSGSVPGMYVLNYMPKTEDYEIYRTTNMKIVRRTLPNQKDAILNELVVLREKFAALEDRISKLESERGSSDGHNVRPSETLPDM